MMEREPKKRNGREDCSDAESKRGETHGKNVEKTLAPRRAPRTYGYQGGRKEGMVSNSKAPPLQRVDQMGSDREKKKKKKQLGSRKGRKRNTGAPWHNLAQTMGATR